MSTRTFLSACRLLKRQFPVLNHTRTSRLRICYGKELVSTQLLSIQNRFYCSSTTIIANADYKEIKELPSKSNILLIDVREPEELIETGQIPTSINIPLGIISQELAPNVSDSDFKKKYGRSKPTTDTTIIFHCKIGRRSFKAAEAAAALGYKHLKNYEGSWLDWAKREGLSK